MSLDFLYKKSEYVIKIKLFKYRIVHIFIESGRVKGEIVVETKGVHSALVMGQIPKCNYSWGGEYALQLKKISDSFFFF